MTIEDKKNKLKHEMEQDDVPEIDQELGIERMAQGVDKVDHGPTILALTYDAATNTAMVKLVVHGINVVWAYNSEVNNEPSWYIGRTKVPKHDIDKLAHEAGISEQMSLELVNILMQRYPEFAVRLKESLDVPPFTGPTVLQASALQKFSTRALKRWMNQHE